MKEEWRDILGAEGLYEVSNIGRVRSVDRVIERSNGLKHTVRSRVLKPAPDSRGYYRCGIMINKKLVTKKVHRLVAEAFCEGDHSLTVDHINGIKSDNNASNLEWVTRAENVRRAVKNGLIIVPKTERKVNLEQVLTIKTFLKNGWGPKKISDHMGVSIHICKDISRNRTWTHVRI